MPPLMLGPRLTATGEHPATDGGVMETSDLYEMPAAGRRLPEDLTPRLASWERIGHPDQVLLRKYLTEIAALTDATRTDTNLALRLDVGLEPGTPLFRQGGDLDNFLYPVAYHLGAKRFVTAWCSKRTGQSAIVLERARPRTQPLGRDWVHTCVAATTPPAATKAWQQQVVQQISPCGLGDGAVEIQIAYRLSPARNWANLWKPTIDALGSLVGEVPMPFHPRDDRITLLGLHRTDDPAIGWDVAVDVWCRPAPAAV
jgi:hypothetical protein